MFFTHSNFLTYTKWPRKDKKDKKDKKERDLCLTNLRMPQEGLQPEQENSI